MTVRYASDGAKRAETAGGPRAGRSRIPGTRRDPRDASRSAHKPRGRRFKSCPSYKEIPGQGPVLGAGATYQQTLSGPGGRRIRGDYRVTSHTPPTLLE